MNDRRVGELHNEFHNWVRHFLGVAGRDVFTLIDSFAFPPFP